MTRLGTLLGFKAANAGTAQDNVPDAAAEAAAKPVAKPVAEPIAQPPAEPAPAAASAATDRPESNVIELDQELFFPIASKLGEDNETVRNLLIDAEHKISELDTIKRSINRLVDPVAKTLRAFEEAKSQKLSLQTQLGSLRTAYNKQWDELAATERRAAELSSECKQLRELVAVAQQHVAALENTGAAQSAELAAHRIRLVDLNRRMAQLAGDLEASREEAERLALRATGAEKRAVQLEAEAHAAQQKLQLAEKEKAAVNGLIDKVHGETAELSRKLSDSDQALAAARRRLAELEAAHTELQADRGRLAAALDDTVAKAQSERIAAFARHEALQARGALSETLLEDARKALTSRAEEIGEYERRMVEAMQARKSAELRLAETERALLDRDQRIKELEQAGADARDRGDALAKAAAARDAAYRTVQNKLRAQDELVKLLEHQLRTARQANDLQLEEMNAQLQRERLERSMAEGALETGRRDIARLLRELAAAQYRLPGLAGEPAAKPAEAAATAPVQSAA